MRDSYIFLHDSNGFKDDGGVTGQHDDREKMTEEGQERATLRSEKIDPLLRAFARSHTSLTANSMRLPSKFSSGRRTRWKETTRWNS